MRNDDDVADFEFLTFLDLEKFVTYRKYFSDVWAGENFYFYFLKTIFCEFFTDNFCNFCAFVVVGDGDLIGLCGIFTLC